MVIKKLIFIIPPLVLAVCLVGCGKKQQPISEVQEPISLDELSKLDISTATADETALNTAPAITVSAASAFSEGQAKAPLNKLEQLPPSGPYKPTVQEIQTALKNTGFYTGSIDGKKGPLTKKAIEDFQKANNLVMDGKVGPKTWGALSRYLNPEPAPAVRTNRRR